MNKFHMVGEESTEGKQVFITVQGKDFFISEKEALQIINDISMGLLVGRNKESRKYNQENTTD